MIKPQVACIIQTALAGRTLIESHEQELRDHMLEMQPVMRISNNDILHINNSMKPELTSLLDEALKGRKFFPQHKRQFIANMNAIEPPHLGVSSVNEVIGTIEPTQVKEMVIDQNQKLTLQVASILSDALKARANLEPHEMQLLGQLVGNCIQIFQRC